MEIQEKPYIYKGNQYGKHLYYSNIEPEEVPLTPGIRVLPAQYFYEKRLMFVLVKRYEPGENTYFPNGGYDIRDEGGGIRSYNLDEVVIHPQVFEYKRHLEKVAKRYSKKMEKLEKKNAKITKYFQNGKRGRPALSHQQVEERKQIQLNRVKTGKKGRPGLSPEEKALREEEKARKRAISGGKRGRPKKIG